MLAPILPSLSKWFYLWVLLAGAVTVVAFSPFEIYPVAWFTPAVLFYALSKAQTKKQHVMLGWLFGIGMFGAGASWPFYSLYVYAHAPLPMALAGTFSFVTLVALLTTALFGLLVYFFRYHALYARFLLFYPAAWVLVEWTRSWLLTGFPWLYLGNSQIDTFFAAYAPITGVLGVSLSCVLISGALLSFTLGNKPQRRVHIENDSRKTSISNSAVVEERFGTSVRILSALIILLLASVGFALQDIQWTHKSGKSLRVSVLQSNISQYDKLRLKQDPKNLKASIDLYRSMTRKSRHSDLIVWPETALFDAFNYHIDHMIVPLQKTLAGTRRSILIGGFNINKDQQFENSILALSAKRRQIYSKRHLVPFGEYIPLLKYVRWMGDWIPYSNMVAGKNDGTLEVAGQIAQMSICYEDAFGAEIIQSLPKASLLVNVTHDGWFTGSFEPDQHMQIARMRSLETGRYMVRATTTGPSGIINEKGKVVATAPNYTRKIITHRVQPLAGATPYVRWGNWLIISVLGLVLLLGIIMGRRRH